MFSLPAVVPRIPTIRDLTFQSSNNGDQPFPDLASVTSLRRLTLTAGFTGPFPSNLSALETLSLANTAFSGILDARQFSSLASLAVSGNRGGLSFPSVISNCSATQISFVTSGLVGPFPLPVLNCPLTRLALNGNAMGPLIPKELFQHPTLDDIDLSSNSFSQLDKFLGNRTRLPSRIALAWNAFAGPITSDFIRTIATNYNTWDFSANSLECPRSNLTDALMLWKKSSVSALSSTCVSSGHKVHIITNANCFIQYSPE